MVALEPPDFLGLFFPAPPLENSRTAPLQRGGGRFLPPSVVLRPPAIGERQEEDVTVIVDAARRRCLANPAMRGLIGFGGLGLPSPPARGGLDVDCCNLPWKGLT